MPIWLHLSLLFILEMMAFFGGALLTFFLFPEATRQSLGGLMLVPMFGGSYVGMIAVRHLLGKFPARCPKCHGPAMLVRHFAIRPFHPTFTCQACGHVHRSRASSNW